MIRNCWFWLLGNDMFGVGKIGFVESGCEELGLLIYFRVNLFGCD